MMRAKLQLLALAGVLIAALANGRTPSSDLKAKIDTMVSAAYKAASVKFPCTLKTQGTAKILSWQTVSKCLNAANDRVQWEDLSLQIQEIRKERRYQDAEIYSALESSLSAHAIPYSEVFQVKDAEALLPLSSSLLKFLPADSLQDLPVYDGEGARIGTFAGIFVVEKVGDYSGRTLKHARFQYTDPSGGMHTPSEQLLMDSYAIRWKEAKPQPGFRLPSDGFIPKH
jgi:hypothetical protein